MKGISWPLKTAKWKFHGCIYSLRPFPTSREHRWPIHIINPVDKTKLSCYTPHRLSTTVSLESYPSIQIDINLTADKTIKSLTLAFF